MYIMLKPLDIVYLFTCMTLNSNTIKKMYITVTDTRQFLV